MNICEAGACSIDKETGALLVQCNSAAVDEDGTAPGFGSIPMMQALGVTSMPYPADKDGHAELTVDEDVPGYTAVVTGGRDTRSAAIAGKLEPGDTVVHSTGPKQAAQLQLKEKTGIAGLLSKTLRAGKTMGLVLNGLKEAAQLFHAGGLIQIDKFGDIQIVNKEGSGILIKGKNVHVIGNAVLGAGNGPLSFAMVPPTGSPGGPASVPLLAIRGVTPGS